MDMGSDAFTTMIQSLEKTSVVSRTPLSCVKKDTFTSTWVAPFSLSTAAIVKMAKGAGEWCIVAIITYYEKSFSWDHLKY